MWGIWVEGALGEGGHRPPDLLLVLKVLHEGLEAAQGHRFQGRGLPLWA